MPKSHSLKPNFERRKTIPKLIIRPGWKWVLYRPYYHKRTLGSTIWFTWSQHKSLWIHINVFRFTKRACDSLLKKQKFEVPGAEGGNQLICILLYLIIITTNWLYKAPDAFISKKNMILCESTGVFGKATVLVLLELILPCLVTISYFMVLQQNLHPTSSVS